MFRNLSGAVREALNFGQRYQVLDSQLVDKLMQSKSDDPQVKEIIKAVPELADFLSHYFTNSSFPALDSQIVAILFNPIERAVLVIGDVNMTLLDVEGTAGRTHVSQIFLPNVAEVTSAVGAAQTKVAGREDKDGELTLKIWHRDPLVLSIDGKSFPYVASLFLKITKFNQLIGQNTEIDRMILLQKYLKGERVFPEY